MKLIEWRSGRRRPGASQTTQKKEIQFNFSLLAELNGKGIELFVAASLHYVGCALLVICFQLHQTHFLFSFSSFSIYFILKDKLI